MKRTTKNIIVNMEIAKKAAIVINERILQNEKSARYELKRFLAEVIAFTSDERNYTPERAAKIIAGIETYYSVNQIDVDLEVEALIDEFSKGLDSKVVSDFAEVASKVNKIIATCPMRKFDNAELYFLEEKDIQELMKLKESFEPLLTNRIYLERFKFSRLVNLLNPDQPAHKYDVVYVPKFQHIKEPESLEKYLPAHYKINRNKKMKDFKEFLNTHGFNQSAVQRLKVNHDAELKRDEEEYHFLLENIDNEKIEIKSKK